jgi:lambda family phage minor tail protein L
MIESDIQKLNPGTIIELYQLDTTRAGDPNIYYLHNGVNELGNSVVFDGNLYTRFPIAATGFDKTGQGPIPRPKVQIANVTGLIGALAKELGDLVSSKLTRIRTFSRYLDAVNFPGGVNPEADPNQIIDRDVWFVDRKASENKVFIEFELSAAFDVQGVMLPRRQVTQNVCTWTYRGAECGYAGGPVADKMDIPTTDPTKDRCGKRLSSCRLRFGQVAELPYGGFPACGLVR